MTIAGEKSKMIGDNEAGKQRREFEKSKPSRGFSKAMSYLENRYNCSGICKVPLFYFSHSIELGPPT